jgi:hypothetical protein
MNFGNIQGLVNTVEQVVFDYEVTGSAVSSISTGNILNGNEDGWYTIIFRLIAGATTSLEVLQFNGDTGTNYGHCGINATVAAVSNYSGTGQTGIPFGYGASAGNSEIHVARVYAKSGAVRLVNHLRNYNISGTTIDGFVSMGSVWNNTADNIISLSVSGTANGLGVGTRIIILKSNNFTNGTPTGVITTPYIKGSWVRVGSQVLGSAASSVTFSGLDGDRDVVYAYSCQYKASGGTLGGALIRLNSDSATNYGYQFAGATSTTIVAGRDGAQTGFYSGTATSAGACGYASGIIFAKSGFIRPCVASVMETISGTTVTYMHTFGYSWNNTASNLTTLSVHATTNNFDTGSQFDLYALRPNG